MNKKNIAGVVIIIVIAGAAFYGGMVYGKSTTPSMGQFANEQFTGVQNGARGVGMRNNPNSGFVVGEIISKDTASTVIKMQDGSTKIILIASSTQVIKSSSGTINDLKIGTNITITGSSNSDGSVTAQNIQIRPNGPAIFGTRNN